MSKQLVPHSLLRRLLLRISTCKQQLCYFAPLVDYLVGLRIWNVVLYAACGHVFGFRTRTGVTRLMACHHLSYTRLRMR